MARGWPIGDVWNGEPVRYCRFMTQCILTVEDTFEIGGRGLIVVPGPTLDAYDGPVEVPVKVKRPDGSTLRATLNFTRAFLTPAPKVPRWELLFRGLSQRDVPIGSEIWTYEPFPFSDILSGARPSAVLRRYFVHHPEDDRRQASFGFADAFPGVSGEAVQMIWKWQGPSQLSGLSDEELDIGLKRLLRDAGFEILESE
ncbi:MAG: hypothetical protein M0D54_19625 [Hyphomonadaceae bacterium JAD_PAG50586_4]|nr:MAG: hypothetical protein M0D54_19625 [Hyphomonadaceae bacterium JAD_PAG50586_4]